MLMDAQDAQDFKHTTLKLFPESKLPNGTWTPKVVGITLLDEEPGFTGVYLRDSEGGLWPARTISHKPVKHHRECCASWMSRKGINEDKRTHVDDVEIKAYRGRRLVFTSLYTRGIKGLQRIVTAWKGSGCIVKMDGLVQ